MTLHMDQARLAPHLASALHVSVVAASTGSDVYFEIEDYYWRKAYGTILDAIGN